MEYLEGTSPQSTYWATLKQFFIYYVIFLIIPGCGVSYTVHDPIEKPIFITPITREITLQVDDSGLKWGNGQVGETLKEAWISNKTFQNVYYPIYPSHKVPIEIRVLARGDIDEDGAGFIKAVFTGLLFLLPVGIIQYSDTLILTADVSVSRRNENVGTLNIETRVDADHTLFSKSSHYIPAAGELALKDFASRISLRLREHPEWFSK